MNTENSITATKDASEIEGHHYPEFLQLIRSNFEQNVATAPKLFKTELAQHRSSRNEQTLFQTFLDSLPSDVQHYTCSCCKDFINTYGTLVTINPDTGDLIPVMWTNIQAAPQFFFQAIENMNRQVSKSRVTKIFVTDEMTWGKPQTGAWTHFAVKPQQRLLYSGHKKPNEVEAQSIQDIEMLERALDEFTLQTAKQSVQLLESGAMDRAEKSLHIAQWFLRTKTAYQNELNQIKRRNILWAAVATAGAGYVHIRNTVLGPLLDDLQSGSGFEAIKRRHAAKVKPGVYATPVAAPTAGAIEEAEKLVEKMGIRPSFRRRQAVLSDIRMDWTPPEQAKPQVATGLFGHLKPRAANNEELQRQFNLPTQTVTWSKFQRDVLPKAEQIEYYTQYQPSNFVCYTTEAVPGSAPIHQWDSAEDRNPVSIYTRVQGSMPNEWNLGLNRFIKVVGISRMPWEWTSNQTNMHKGICLFLENATATPVAAGSMLFPEVMKSELHSIRSVIQAYSDSVALESQDVASAAIGIALNDRSRPILVRVTYQDGMTAQYNIDRLE